eukprot:361291-Chlamydomonas_euryale.AAC.7
MDALPDDVETLKRMVLATQKDRDDAQKDRDDAQARAEAAEQELLDISAALQGLRLVKMILMVAERKAIASLDLSSRRTSTNTYTNVEALASKPALWLMTSRMFLARRTRTCTSLDLHIVRLAHRKTGKDKIEEALSNVFGLKIEYENGARFYVIPATILKKQAT